jgi:predicted DNA-binding antitoxin AbrB/MazE fold protein
MQVEAIYDNGRLEFIQPIKLKSEHFRLLVHVPESEILLNDALPTQEKTVRNEAEGGKLLEEFREILGPFRAKHPAASVAEDKAAFADELAEKYLK